MSAFALNCMRRSALGLALATNDLARAVVVGSRAGHHIENIGRRWTPSVRSFSDYEFRNKKIPFTGETFHTFSSPFHHLLTSTLVSLLVVVTIQRLCTFETPLKSRGYPVLEFSMKQERMRLGRKNTNLTWSCRRKCTLACLGFKL